MATYSIEDTTLTTIGDAIRAKRNFTNQMTPAEMAVEIGNITGGVVPTGTINITTNGTHDVTNYATANVNVSGPIFNSQGFANDSWELISQIAEAGVAHLYYRIGDIKYVSINSVTDATGYNQNIENAQAFKTYETVNGVDMVPVQIVGFNHYKSGTDATKKNGIVLMLKNLKKPLYYTGFFGWVGGDGTFSVRGYLNQTVYNCLPTDLQQIIKPSTIPSKNNYSGAIVEGTYKMFIPTLREMNIAELETVSKGLESYDYPAVLPFFADYVFREERYRSIGFYTTAEKCGTRSMYDGNWEKAAVAIFNDTNMQGGHAASLANYGESYPFYCPVILFCV